MKIVRWLRSPEARPYWALFLWMMTAANLAWITLDLTRRYDMIVEGQTLRIQCQVNGGWYGAMNDETTGCFRRASEAEAPGTR